MDILAIEAFSWSPHLETAAEICATEAEAGRSAALAFIDVDNPDEDPPPLWRRRVGCAPIHKVDQLCRLLVPFGVAHIAEPTLPQETIRRVDDWADRRVASADELR